MDVEKRRFLFLVAPLFAAGHPGRSTRDVMNMDEMEEPEIFLIKFGNYERLLQLQDEGLLYMKPLPYFWKIEDDELRGDPFDGVSKIERGHKVTIGKEKIIGGNWIMRMHPPEPIKINIFCMYALRPLIEESFPVDERNFRFGEHALVID